MVLLCFLQMYSDAGKKKKMKFVKKHLSLQHIYISSPNLRFQMPLFLLHGMPV